MSNDAWMKLLLLLLCVTGAAYLSTAHASAAGAAAASPSQATELNAYVIDKTWLQVVAVIPDGQAIRRDSVHFEITTPGIQLKTPRLPAGSNGLYRGKTTFDLHYRRSPQRESMPRQLAVAVTYQACGGTGECAAAATHTATATIPDTASPRTAAGKQQNPLLQALSSLGRKLGFGGEGGNDFLKPDEAFVLSTEVLDANTILTRWQIADGYYLYRDKLAFRIKNDANISLGEARLPSGKFKVDETFGRSEVYYHELEARLPVARNATQATHVVLETKYQGCADDGFCYPPITKVVELDLPAAATGANDDDTAALMATAGTGGLSETDRIAWSLANDSLLVTALSFYGIGLLLAFTPCVFPMVPILSSLIVGQGGHITARHGFLLSLVFVLPMAVTYTGAGVAAALMGKNLQALFQAPWIIATFSGVFVLLALSMFGLYDLQLPSRWQSKLTELSNKQRGGTWLGAASMGFFSALIVGPCVAPPLAGALLYISQSHNAMVGGSALFAMSLGMGTPLLAFGASAGKLLPKVGQWMAAIKALFGVLLLAVAIWLLQRILPAGVTLALWAALLIISAAYLGAFTRLPPDAGGRLKLGKGGGMLAMAYGLLLLVGAASGGKSLFQPLAGLEAGGGTAVETAPLRFTPVKGLDGLRDKLAVAGTQGTPVMLDFYADWCTDCIRMERTTFANPRVKERLSRLMVLQTDVTAYDARDQALLKRYGLPGPPAILFFDPDGTELRHHRLIGYKDAEDFLAHLNAGELL